MIYNGEDSDSESFPVPEGLSPEQKQKMLIETQKKLDEAKQLRTKNSLKHYAVKEKMHPYCGGNVACVGDRRRPFSYDVVSGSITSGSAIFIDTTGGLVSLEEYNTFFTVERYFDFIEAQLKSSPIEVSIVYDSIFGYPKQIYIDRADSVDDEIYKDFELISK